MKKINKLGTWYMIMCLATALVAGFMQSCNKNDIAARATIKSTHGDTIYGDHAWALMYLEDGILHFHAEHDNGEVLDHHFALPAELVFYPQDTLIGNPPVAYVGRDDESSDTTAEYPYADCFFFRTVVDQGKDVFSFGTDNGTDTTGMRFKHSHTIGYANAWGMIIPIPATTASVTYKEHTTAEAGGDGTWDYTRVRVNYTVKRYGLTMPAEAYKTLKRAAGSHDFISKELQSAVWTPIEYNNGFVTRARVDVKIASFYEGLDPQIDEEQIEVDCPVHIAGDSSMYASSFDFSHSSPVTGTYSTTGTYTEGHFQVTKKSITYSVGTSIFTRVSSFGCFDLVWSDGTYTFPIQTPDYGSFNEVSYTVDDLSAQNGYDRKRVTNTISASINGISASAPIRTTVLVESQTPPPPQEGETVLIDSALIYVNETTSISRLTFQVQYPDGTSDAPYNVDCTIHNDVSSPAEGPFYTNDFNNVGVVGQITLEPIVYDGYYYDGDFLKKQYHRNAKVDCGVFELPWVLSWEDPYYVPMGNKKMPSAQYSAFVSSGNYTDDLGEITSQNETWLRKIWTQWITTEFNNHNHQYSGTAEVRAPNTIPKITPDWFGNPMEAHYTLVQPYVGAQFQDMIVFRFEHGIIMAPNGIPDTNLIYAFTAADAAAHGVDQVYTPQAWWSGVFLNGKWWPAYITITSSEWTYSYDGTPIHSHTVQKANAFILNIGYECNPDPQHQYYTISNGVITICYNAHNQGETVTAQCQIR